MQEIGIMEVGGFRVGHAQDERGATGCTVLLPDEAAPAGVDVRGGGPASRETPLLSPLMDAKGIHAVLLSGGSAFGLDAAGGVMRYLEERGVGFDVGVTKVPLVCQSCLFDLRIGAADARPDAAMAYAACEGAQYGAPREGNHGAGLGCTVGKYRGAARAMKGGFGTYAVRVGQVCVGALVAVNALGDIFDCDSGAQLAGLRTEDGRALCSTEAEMCRDIAGAHDLFTGNTTLGIIVTNGAFDKSALCKIAGMAHNGYARAIRPVHTTADGDTIYALSTGAVQADLNAVGTLAATVMARAIGRAVCAAQSAYGFAGRDALA